MKHELPVTYLCWDCGSQVTQYEEAELSIPAKEVWNICPECNKHDDAPKSEFSGQLDNSKSNIK